MENIQTEMCLLLNCTIETYRRLMYRNGIAYLYWYLPCDARKRRVLEGSKIYWAWFRLQFEIMDDALANDAEFLNEDIRRRRQFFQQYHNPQHMSIDIKPNDVVLAELNKKEEAVCV